MKTTHQFVSHVSLCDCFVYHSCHFGLLGMFCGTFLLFSTNSSLFSVSIKAV